MIALAIPHCPWIPERRENLARLMDVLDPEPDRSRIFDEKAHNSVWSGKLWQWCLDTGEDYALQVQDDVELPPFFWRMLLAIIEAVPNELIGLHLHHPSARIAAARGDTFVTTMSCVGMGYVFPRPLLVDFMRWRAGLGADRVYNTSEDVLIDAWCIFRRRRVWHPVPTCMRAGRLASTGGGGGRYDVDDQYHRATVMDWTERDERDLCDPGWWRAGLRSPPQHLVFAGIARPGVSRRELPADFTGRNARARI
jgi:hypothetical protein